MALDASIYARFAPAPRSAAQYAGEFEQLGAMQDQRRDNALARSFKIEEAGRQRAAGERGNALRQLRQSLAGRPEAEVIEGVRGAGYFEEAGAMEKDYLGRQELRGKVAAQPVAMAKDRATADKTATDARGAALEQYRGLLPRINSREAAVQWITAQYQDPAVSQIVQSLGPMEQAIAEIPQDPQAFMQWRNTQEMGIKAVQDGIAAQARDANAAKTPSMREFEFAIQRGDIPPTTNFSDWERQNKRAGASKVEVNTGDKKLPAGVVKQQDDLIDRMTIAKSTQSDLAALRQKIADGKLDFGPVRNLVNQGRNLAGASTEESRNFASFKSSLEKLRNDSLKLNAGVQTDGDAQRAWNELFQSINDRDLVMQRLEEIEAINARGAQLQQYRLQVLRENFGAGPLPPAPVSAPAATPAAPGAPRPSVSNW